MFSYIHRLGSFLGFKIFNFSIFWGFIFGGMKNLWIYFGVITKLEFILWSCLCILGSFRGYFFGLPKFQIFFWVLEFPDIFFFGGGGG